MNNKVKIQSRKVQFEGFDGSQLAAILDFPLDISPSHYVIVSHCFTCSKQTLTTARLSRGLAQAGLAVLRFDFTGLGDSEGDFAKTHFRSMVKDIECAADWLAAHYDAASILIGHSMGGTASLAASQGRCAALSRVQKMITLASPAYPAHVLHHFGAAMHKLQRGESTQIRVAGQAYPVKPGFVEDVQSYDMEKQMQNCGIPIMAVCAGNDALTGPDAAELIMQFTKAAGTQLQIDEADHLFSDRAHAAQLLSAVLAYIKNEHN